MANEERLFRLKLDGKSYDLTRDELTVGVLRQFKQWYGAEYGRYLVFINLLVQGDADAVACAVWLVKRNAGEPTKEPRFIDIPVAQSFVDADAEDDAEGDADAPDPTEAGQTPDSPPTPPNSDPSTSST